MSKPGIEKRKTSDELILAYKELSFQKLAKEKHEADLIIANKELVCQNDEKEKCAEELIIANKELVYQTDEKEKCAEELIIANKELVYQNDEKEKRAKELIISTIVDITERKKDEEYFGHLAAIVESSDDAIISKSLDGTIKSWNKGSERMFGYTAKEAIGNHISLIIPPKYINEEKEIIDRIRNNEIIAHFETVRNKKSGEQFFVSLTVSPLKDRSGNIIGVSKIIRDITEQKKAEENLQKSLREISDYKYALEESCIVAITDQKGIINYANDNFCKISKYSCEELIGQDHRIINSSYHPKEFIRDLWLTIANGKIWRGELKNRAKDESTYWVDTTIVPFLNANGKPYQYVAIRADITERKKAEELIIANNEEKEKRATELVVANKELAFQNNEKEKRAAELIIANKELLFQNEEKEKRAAELIIANKELVFQNEEKEKRAAELIIANKELTFQNEEKEKRAAELIIANKELAFQNEEKEKRAAELIIANKELAFQNEEKEKRAAELIIANKELTFQNEEKEKRAAELIIANKELAFQNEEKEKRAAELIIANKELTFQNEEKEKRAAELIIANKELAFQNEEKEKRAAELITANKELVFQNEEKEKRAAELIIANKELAFQNEEKEKRAAELIIANKELAFQNEEKEKRAAELIIANKELTFQNKEKEKRAAELMIANKELEQFSYIASHDLQEPLRTVSNYMQVFEEDYLEQLDDNASKYLNSVKNATRRMSMLIKSLLDFSRLGRNTKLAKVDIKKLIYDVMADLDTMIKTSNASIEVTEMPRLNVYEIEIRQLFQNLITNAIKFRKKDTQLEIRISSEKINEKWKFSVSDNGIGIAPVHFERVFDIFQRLQTDENYEGNGIGLANCKKIVQLHQGEIWLESNRAQGTTFHFSIPNLKI